MQPYRSSRPSADGGYRCEPLEQRVLLSAAQLVRDVNLTPIDNLTPNEYLSASRDTATLGSKVFFSALGYGVGAELFVADTATGQSRLVKDFAPGSSHPQFMAAYGDAVYFFVDRGHGTDQDQRELWRTDGTDAGTSLLKTFSAYRGNGFISRLVPVNGYLYFGESDATASGTGLPSLWRTDGTADGTVIVKSFAAPTAQLQHLTPVGDTLYFSTESTGAGPNTATFLWRSDGTTDGTVPVTTRQLDLRVFDTQTSYDDGPLPVTSDGVLYFVANDGTHGHELWRSDGTDAGTSMVAELRAGSADGARGLAGALGNEVYFNGWDATHGFELWHSDGTPAGTAMVADLNTAHDSSPLDFTAVNGRMYFTASTTPSTPVRPWVTDGTPAGTVQLADAKPALGLGTLAGFTPAGGRTLFVATDPAHGQEVWTTDGTPAGTSVIDLNPGPAGSAADRPLNLNGQAYFTGTDGQTVFGLFRSDGTAGGTALVAPVDSPSDNGLTNSQPGPSQFASIPDGAGGQVVLFAPTTAGSGTELWRSDGTAAGTSLVKDLNPGTAGSSPTHFTTAGGLAYFAATTAALGTELWRSDGTEAGTFSLGDLSPGASSSNASPIGALGNRLLFTTFDPTHGSKLWMTDGTPGGTTFVKDVPGGGPGVVVNGVLVFYGGTGIWRSDGTDAGTFFLGSGSGPIALSNGLAVFRTNVFNNVEQLWKTDGTVAGTVRFADLGPSTTGGEVQQLTDVNGTLFFSFQRSDEGRELWRADDIAGGAGRLKDIYPGTAGSFPADLVNFNGKLYFGADDGTHGGELWTSDGTTEGTVLVKDINPGSPWGFDSTFVVNVFEYKTWLTNVNGTLYFAATDPSGTGLWRSDGTAGGTHRVPDLYGGAMSTPSDLLNVGGSLFFAASLPATGTELFELTPDPAGVSATPGSTYSFAGLGSNKVLTVTAGTVTLSSDLSAQYPGASVSLDASNGATVVFDAEQHLANVSLSGGASIIDDSANAPPPAEGGSTGSVGPTTPTPTPTPAPTPTPIPTPTPPAGPVALSPAALGYARDGAYAGNTFSNDPNLVVKKGAAGFNRVTYLTFDLSRVKAIHSAKLRLYGQTTAGGGGGAGVAVRAYAAHGAWPPGRLTWKNRPTAAGAPLASATVKGTTARWYDWDLTAFLKSQKAAGHNLVTIALQAAVATDAAALFLQGRSGNATRPQLVVT